MGALAVGRLKVPYAALAVAALLFLTGCGQRSEPTGAAADLYPVTVAQTRGSPVILDRPPATVAALTPSAANLVSSVLGRRVPAKTGAGNADLVVTTLDADTIKPAGAYVAPDSSVDDVEQALTELGLLLDRPLRARQLVEQIQEKRDIVRARLRGVKPVTVFVDTGLFTTVSTHSLLGSLITEAGGTNVAGSRAHGEPFPVSRLVRLNPDVYLATSDSQTTLADLERDPRTRRLKAVRDGRFAILASKVLEPGGETGTELVAIARYLHPDAFR